MLSLIASDMALAAAAYVRRFNCKPQLMRVSNAGPGRMSEQFQTIPHARVSVIGRGSKRTSKSTIGDFSCGHFGRQRRVIRHGVPKPIGALDWRRQDQEAVPIQSAPLRPSSALFA